ncbi:MAG: sulfatase-like hydrolase/transferase [Verrucomicrobiota bacterium]
MECSIKLPLVPKHRLASVVSLILAILFATSEIPAESKPNILFIFTDDQSHETIHHLGNQEIITPHLDRLAQSGVAFTNAYNVGAWAGAVCIASRTSINTGRMVWNAHAIERNLDEHVDNGEFWSQIMDRAGYETYMSGKWHVKTSTKPLFENQANIRGGMPKQTPEGYFRPKENDPWSPDDPQFGGFWKGGKHWSEVLADDAENFLEKAAHEDEPFFMYLAFSAPHDPRQAPREYLDMYTQSEIAVPDSFVPEYPLKQEIGCHMMDDGKGGVRAQRDESLSPWPRTPVGVQLHRHEYYAAITHMDAQIGRILDALEKTGKAANTYIFFTSDHGLACGHHGLLGKQNMYEHSVKAPLIVSGPGLQKNKTREAPVYLQDIMPTTIELAGAAIPDYVDFHSLLPQLKSAKAPSSYGAIYNCFRPDLQRMIRSGDHKLILYPEAKTYRLFNLKKDPTELEDLASLGGKHARKAKQLFGQFLDLQVKMNDPLDLTSLYTDLH